MSKMFEYITSHGGDVARLEASLEHALGLLSAELEDNGKHRAEIERLRETLQFYADASVTEFTLDLGERARVVLEQKAPDVSYVCPDCGESIRLGFGHMPGCNKTAGRS